VANTHSHWRTDARWENGVTWLSADDDAFTKVSDGGGLRIDDDIFGTRFDDLLHGTAGDDKIDGRKGADTMLGGAGNDVYIVDNLGDQVVEVIGEGADTVKAKVDFTLGGNVENLLLTGSADLQGSGNLLNNRIDGNKGRNLLSGLDGDDTLVGHRGDDSLLGGNGSDWLDGGADNDRLDGGLGVDTMAGGPGDDVFFVDGVTDTVMEGVDAGRDAVNASISWTIGANVEDLVLLGNMAIQGTGNELANRIDGNRASNELDGAAGNDILVGHRGDDTLLGGEGNDYLDGSAENDSLDGGAGADQFLGGTGDDTYLVDDLNDLVLEYEASGVDTVVTTVNWTLGDNVENLSLGGDFSARLVGIGNGLGNVITCGIGDYYVDGGDGNDTITGSFNISPGHGDTLLGGSGNDSIKGGGPYADDSIDGGLGNDTLSSSTGRLFGGDGDDLLVGGPGYGHHAAGNYLDGGAGNDTLKDGAFLYGGDGDDKITSDRLTDISGGIGNDTITGAGGGGYNPMHLDAGDGDDFVDVTSVNEPATIAGGNGNDVISATGMNGLTVDGGAGDDSISGSSWSGTAFSITGGAGSDAIQAYGYGGTADGGDGDDWIDIRGREGFGLHGMGGEGNDTLVLGKGYGAAEGGNGSDTFILTGQEIQWFSILTLTDFESAIDHVAVSQSALPVGNGDLLVDGGVTIHGPGGFDSSAELVILDQQLTGNMTLEAAAAAIGNSNEAYAEGQTSTFVVSNGVESLVLYFQSSGGDAVVSSSELSILAHLSNGAQLQEQDFLWTA
jgi:Ca2+-binding RTX toxin-like protein